MREPVLRVVMKRAAAHQGLLNFQLHNAETTTQTLAMCVLMMASLHRANQLLAATCACVHAMLQHRRDSNTTAPLRAAVDGGARRGYATGVVSSSWGKSPDVKCKCP
jgi:hypothetical protein